ncbi:FtsQ-type POTRA domain-containing protein [uncultured Corynebacterium sp.]|uniref:cell division protein FtsQ/DivIB n=1 Tax=uncultured Corynebacterium sp. TaxID=159447 RepID=UPI0025D8A248|nr:FtsQ-type POTRA domain-containing protein [uncultured Corynebacterium sp.]
MRRTSRIKNKKTHEKSQQGQKIQKAKSAPRKRLQWLVAGLVALVVLLGVLAYVAPIVKVSQIDVQGTTHADPQAIREASAISAGDNMLRLDMAEAAKGVSTVPWVEKVTVKRSWPTTVTVDVTEHQAIGYVMDGDTPHVVDEKGTVFLTGVKPEGALEFKKAKADDARAIDAATKALTALSDDLRGKLEGIEAESADSIRLFFPNQAVYWGSADSADEKAEATRIVLGREGNWNVSNPAMPTVK